MSADLQRLATLAANHPDATPADREVAARVLAGLRRAKHRQLAVTAKGHRLGEDHPRAVLTDAQVDDLLGLLEQGRHLAQRARRAAGLSQRQLAARFGVSQSALAGYLSGRRRACTPDRYVSRDPARRAAAGAFTAEHVAHLPE